MGNKAKIIAWGMVVFSVLVSLLTYFVPTPPSELSTSQEFHFNIYLSVATALLQLMAAIMFLRGMGAFKTQLKVAFGIICAGVILFGLAQLQAPIISSNDLWDSVWVRGGIVVIPYLAPILLMFVGMKRFAHLLEVRTAWTSFWLVFGVAVAGGAFIALLPHAPIFNSEIQFRISMGVSGWSMVFLLLTTVLTLRVRQLAGHVYKEALLWFGLAVGMATVASINYLLINLFFGDKSPLIDHGGTSLPFAIGALIFARAGYAFWAISFAKEKVRTSDEPVSLVDVVIATAGEASNPELIDTIMEPVRGVTATMTPGEALNDEQVRELNLVYKELEEYLVNNEPVRKFTAEQVRRTIMDKLGIDQTAVPLWKLPAQQ